MRATRDRASPSRLAMRRSSWLPSTQLGQAPAGTDRSIDSTSSRTAAAVHGMPSKPKLNGMCSSSRSSP